jgi:hypothetical protein
MQHDIIKQKIKHVCVSIALCIYEIQNIILDTTIYWTFHRSEHQGMAKKTFKFAPATLWNSLTVAEYLSSACRTATFSTIPGLH